MNTVNLTNSVNFSHELTQMITNENKQDEGHTTHDAGYSIQAKTFMDRASCIMY